MLTISKSMRVLQRMREAKGNPSYARIAEAVNGIPSESTIGRMFRGEVIPEFENVRAVIQYLEGDIDEYIAARTADGYGLNETYGDGPIPPRDFREVATAADLNRLTEIYTNALHERDEIYREHTQTRTDAYNRGLAALRTEHAESTRLVEAAHKGEISSLKEAHKADIADLKEAHSKEISSITAAHVREVRSKDRWITIMAVLSVLCVAAMIIMMIAAIRNPAVNLFGT